MKPFQRALITGASGGLGEALCKELSSRGISLILTGRDASKLKALASTLKTETIILEADLADPLSRKKVINIIQQLTPDLIINNAGYGLYGDALSHTTKEQMDLLEVNANAVLEITLEAARSLIQSHRKGTILNISSAAAFLVFPCFSVYAASKAFVMQCSQALDQEFSSQGVRVLTSCPGQIHTHFRERASKGFPQEKGLFIMSAETAVKHLMKQLSEEKPLMIFDLRYRLMIWIARFLLPKSFLEKRLRTSLKDRYGKTP